jgi:hypothetical protein
MHLRTLFVLDNHATSRRPFATLNLLSFLPPSNAHIRAQPPRRVTHIPQLRLLHHGHLQRMDWT